MQNWKEFDDKTKRDIKLSGDAVVKKIQEDASIINKNDLPNALWTLTALTRLEITKISSLEFISPEIFRLFQLKELIISDNKKLTSIPSNIGKIVELKNLILENNNLSEVPIEITNLKNLQVLNISHNQLKSLPDQFAKLTEIITLNLTKNSFESFPNTINKLPRLCNLLFAYNLLQDLGESTPDDWSKMNSLQVLDLSNNQFKEIPSSIANASKLKDLKLDGNPFKDKKFIKLLESKKTKDVLIHLRKMAPKPAPKLEPEPPTSSKITLNTLPNNDLIQIKVSNDQKMRPYFAAVVYRNLVFTEVSFKEFIDIQTEIHQKVCNKRSLAAFGTHDLNIAKDESVPLTFLYKGISPKEIDFIPLKQEESVNGPQLISFFEKCGDSTMLKYLSMIKDEPLWPVFEDINHNILSLPPVINSKYSQISVSTQDILVECSSSQSQEICVQVLNEVTDKLCRILLENSTSESLIVEQVKVVSENGHIRHKYPLPQDIQHIISQDLEYYTQ